MPLAQQELIPFTKQSILDLYDNQIGIYGIINPDLPYNKWIYIGKGDIRARMLAHYNGDIPKIFDYFPSYWVNMLQKYPDDWEKLMILKYKPICNRRVG